MARFTYKGGKMLGLTPAQALKASMASDVASGRFERHDDILKPAATGKPPQYMKFNVEMKQFEPLGIKRVARGRPDAKDERVAQSNIINPAIRIKIEMPTVQEFLRKQTKKSFGFGR